MVRQRLTQLLVRVTENQSLVSSVSQSHFCLDSSLPPPLAQIHGGRLQYSDRRTCGVLPLTRAMASNWVDMRAEASYKIVQELCWMLPQCVGRRQAGCLGPHLESAPAHRRPGPRDPSGNPEDNESAHELKETRDKKTAVDCSWLALLP